MILDEFLVKLGVISDPKDIDTFVGGLQKVATVATAVVGVVGTATAAITSFFGAALEGLDSLNDIAQDTDTDLAYIQKLGYAAQLSGSSVESANASVKGLSQTIGEAASGLGRGKAAFEAYGLSAKNADGSVKSVGEMLDDVRGKMISLSKAEQLSMLGKLGIDQSMIGLLNSSSEAVATLFQEAEDLGLVTAAGADAAGEFNDTMDQMNMVMGAIRTNIAVGLAPQLTNIVGRLRDWLIRNKELIREGIDKAVTVILALWRAIMRAVDVADKIISKTIGWKAALVILGGTLVWLNKTMLLAFATNPITLIAAAIAGLILLVDDLVTFMEGGESMFDWSWAVPIIEDVGKAIDVVSAVLQDFWDRGGKYVLAGFGGLWEFVKGFVAWLGNAIAAVFNLMTGDFDGFLSRSQASLEGLKQMFFGVVGYVKNLFAVWLTVLGVDVDALVVRFTGAWDSIKAGFSGAMGAITGAWDKTKVYLGAAWDWLVEKFDAVMGSLSAAWAQLTARIKEATASLVEHFTQVWNVISNAFRAVVALLTGDFDGFLSHIDKVIDAVKAIFANAWNVIAAGASDLFRLLGADVGAMADVFSGAWSWISSKWDEATASVISAWNGAAAVLLGAIDVVKNGFGAAWDWIAGKWDEATNRVISAWNGAAAVLLGAIDVVENGFGAAWDWIAGKWDEATASVSGAWAAVETLLLGSVDAVKAKFGEAWGWIATAWQESSNAILEVWDGVNALLFGAIDALKAKFAGAWDSIKSGFSGAMGFITKLWDTVSGSITSGLKTISGTLGWLGDKLGLTGDKAAAAAQKVGAASDTAAIVAGKVSAASDTVVGVQAAAHPANQAGATPSQNTINSTETNKTNTQKNEIHITQHINTDNPQAAGQYATDGIKREFQRAEANYGGAVKG